MGVTLGEGGGFVQGVVLEVPHLSGPLPGPALRRARISTPVKNRPPVTLKAMASELGLSPSTVSRVLNDQAGSDSRWASPETRQRILDMASRLGYIKNPYAESLRTATSRLIGVVVPRLQDYVLATIYEGIDEAATKHGYLAVVANSLDERELHRQRVRKLLDRRVDGFILGDVPFDASTLGELRQSGTPFVLVNRRAPGHSSVTCNDYLGGQLAGEHLIGLGVRKVFLLAGDNRMSTSLDRTAGFADALKEGGVELPSERIAFGGFDAKAGEVATRALLASVGTPEAIFAVNDFAAIGALGVLRERGLSVPSDVKVIGYNDTPLAGGIGLSTVHSQMHEMGRLGLEKLIQKISGQEPTSVQLDPSLIIRSTA